LQRLYRNLTAIILLCPPTRILPGIPLDLQSLRAIELESLAPGISISDLPRSSSHSTSDDSTRITHNSQRQSRLWKAATRLK